MRYDIFVGTHVRACTGDKPACRQGRCWHLDAAVARDNATRLELSVMDEAIELAKGA